MQRSARSSKETPKFIRQLDRFTERDLIMNYEKMKALMEASREEPAVQRQTQVKEFPKPDSKPDWKYLNYVRKEQIAA